jgi:glycosyltransferase involved in cell wall biosynthesis
VNTEQLVEKNSIPINISVVIPTCNRKKRLLSLLKNLNNSFYKVREVIIVDSGEDRPTSQEIKSFENLDIMLIQSVKSVCIQRNLGIKKAKAPWIFLCDDDIEVPTDYLQKLVQHIKEYKDVGAVSGLVLQKEHDDWKAKYSINSSYRLLWTFIFHLSIWGEINCSANNLVLRKIKKYYQQKGNHISKTGWPVITDFSGDFFSTPIYGLGAALIRKEWLTISFYDEALDRYGIGDNYGVAADFPQQIHVLTNACAFHHQESSNRLQKRLQYFRRVLALDYFRRTKKNLNHIKKRWLLWSLFGNLLGFVLGRNWIMMQPAVKAILIITFNINPYYKAKRRNEKLVEPV